MNHDVGLLLCNGRGRCIANLVDLVRITELPEWDLVLIEATELGFLKTTFKVVD